MAINQYEFPVDLPDSERPDDHRHAHAQLWATIVIFGTSALLALFNAQSLAGWTAELAPSPAVVRLVAATDRWKGMTDAVGLGRPRAAMHAGWKRLEAARWPGQAEAVAQ